jgi:DNA-binding XRE family transcriptional regulator
MLGGEVLGVAMANGPEGRRARAALLAGIPTLDDLAADPSKASGLPFDAAQMLWFRCVVVQQALAPALLAASYGHGRQAPAEDRLLDVAEAARRLAVCRDYVYRHAAEWPFTVRRGRKLGFSEQGLAAYLRGTPEVAPWLILVHQLTSLCMGLLLQQWRTRRGLSLRALGVRSGVSYVTIAKIEAGTMSPTVGTLEKLAAALGIGMRDLFAAAPRPRARGRKGW